MSPAAFAALFIAVITGPAFGVARILARSIMETM